MTPSMHASWLRRFALLALLAVMAVPAGARATPNCYPVPDDECRMLPVHQVIPVDMNVIAVGNLFTPDAIDVRLNGNIYFQNFDGDAHTITIEKCDTSKPSFCNKALEIGALGPRAITLTISPHDFLTGVTYRYYCQVHAGMRGTFTVH